MSKISGHEESAIRSSVLGSKLGSQVVADKPLFNNLRKLINIVDSLRDIGLQDHISLPRIAVCGKNYII
jgi:hypothetical protein